MSSHGHAHDHGGHSHTEPSQSHSPSHDGVECDGHDAGPPAEAELSAQKQERLAFDRVVASFYHYEPHSVRTALTCYEISVTDAARSAPGSSRPTIAG